MFSLVGEISAGIQIQVRGGWPLVKAYASNPLAKSPLISLMGTLSHMGFPREVQSNLAGFYKANVSNGIIEFNLDREIK